MISSAKKRVTGIDVLKILSMLLIILQHLLFQGQIVQSYELGSSGYVLTQSLYGLTFFAVNCYALASGFLCYKTKIKYSRLLNIWLQTFFYSVLIYIIFVITGLCEFKFKFLISYFLPFITGKYWYVTAYFLLFLFMPLLNVAIEKISKQTFQQVLWLLFVFMSCGSILYLVFFYTDPFKLQRGYTVLWLLVLYLFGAYIGKYEVYNKLSKVKLIILFIVLLSSCVSARVILNLLHLEKYSDVFVSYISPFNLILSLLFFAICLRVKINSLKMEKFCKLFSSATLGVFLIHTHPMVRELLTPKLKVLTDLNAFLTVLILGIIVLAVFFLCAFIDVLRLIFFKLAKINFLTKKLDDKINFH